MTAIVEPTSGTHHTGLAPTRSWPILAGVWIISIVYVGSGINRDWTPHDEGLLAQTATRLLAGQLPHRDFGDAYTGLLTAYHATAFILGGQSLLTLRIALLVAVALWVPAFYAIAARFLSPLGAALATATAVAWSVPNYAASMPTWYNLFLTTAGTLAVIQYLETTSRRWLSIAGLCAGLSILVKIVGVYFILAVAVFLVWRSLNASGAASDDARNGRTSRWRAAGLATAVAILLILGLLGLVRHGLTAATVLHFLVPGVAVGVVVTAAGWRARSVSWTMLSRDAIAFAVGAAAPIALFLIPYISTRTIHSLIAGVFILPLRRLVSATLPPPGLADAARAGPIVVGLWVSSVSGEKIRHILTLLAIPVGLGGLLLSTHGSLYLDIMNAARAAVPITTLVAAAILIRPLDPARPPIDRDRVALVVFVTALFSLVQFPFAPAVYFCYVAPLALLSIIAVTAGLSRRGPSGAGGILLAFALCFALLRMNTRAYDTLERVWPAAKPTATLPLPRGGLRISAVDSATYAELIPAIRAHRTGEYMYCTPDCPESYFLAGLQNPTPVIFDFLSDSASDVARTMRALDARGVGVVAVNRQPRFSPLDTNLVRALRHRYPDSLRTGYFTVRWR